MFRNTSLVCLAILGAFVCHAAPLHAIQVYSHQDSLVNVIVRDGHTFTGKIIEQDGVFVTIETASGLIIKIPQSQIVELDWLKRGERPELLWRTDPNYSRLLFAPTGRPLRAGDGYFSNHYLFLTGLAVGLTNNLSVLAGISIIPAVGLGDQMVYVAPKLGHRITNSFSASIGTLFFSVADVAGGLAYAVNTLGGDQASLTTGAAVGYLKEEDGVWELGDDLVVMVGGHVRLSNSVALVSENWFVLRDEFKFSEQPLAFAFRFFGDRLATDIGFVVVGEVVKEGLPIPWLGAVYNFGKR